MKTHYLFILILVVSIYSCTIHNSQPAKSDKKGANLKVFVLDGGYMALNNLDQFTLDESYNGQRKTIDNPVFLIEHNKGRLIWDVGLPDSLAARNTGAIDTTTVATLFYVRKKLIDQINAMNLTPDSIDYLTVSHTHIDHIGNANYFKNSTWIVDERELEYAMRDGAATSNYDSLRTSKKITFKDRYDVFGDKSVIIHSMPGHTPGHMCLQIELKHETLLLTGDLYHFNEQRQFKRMPKFNTDVQMTLQSMEKFENLVNQKKAKVIIQHESTHYAQLPVYPNYLE
jgi:glyoxylase-like metal-dependent hydrolase (beta-lactamase superfamily II)